MTMINNLMKKYALTYQGAKDLIKSTIACAIFDLVMMIPVSLIYFMVKELLEGGIPKNHYWIYFLGIIICIILIVIAQYFDYTLTYFSTYKESSLRRINLAEKLRKLPLSFFVKKDLADLTTTLMTDCATLETGFSHYFPRFFGSIISTIIISISLFFFDWRLAIAALWVLPVSLIIVLSAKKVQNHFTRKSVSAKVDLADGIQEFLETNQDLKSNNYEKTYLIGLKKKIKKVEGRAIKSELGAASFVMPASMILKVGIATVALVGSLLLINNQISLLIFFMYLLVVSRIYEPLNSALQNLAAILAMQINIDRMNEIENHPIQNGNLNFTEDSYDLTFENVEFSYDNSEKVINNVSFVAKQGQVTALIGPSGGGKSTLAKLAARFWDVKKGSIRIGNMNINEIDPENLLKEYSIVFQNVTLFNDTIMENIRIGRKDATDEEVIEAAKNAQCDDFISNLPMGYKSIIGENGKTLSGGERQRISIARALLKNAPIILLDEATASLDAENETKIQKAISKLIENKTVLIIAHRMRTVESADKLVYLNNGVIQEQGTPKELKQINGKYASMLSLQKKSNEWKIKN